MLMAKAEATVEELAGMIERGELRLPELQRRYVWRSTRALTATVSSHFWGLIDRGLLPPPCGWREMSRAGALQGSMTGSVGAG